MGDKDFAQLAHPEAEENKAIPPQSKSILIVLLAVMLAIGCFAVGFFMGEKHGMQSNQGNRYETLVKKLKEQQKKIEAYKQAAKQAHTKEADTSQVGELTFYNQLPKESVTPEPLEHVEANPPQASNVIDETPEDIVATEKRLDAIIAQQLQTPQQQFRIQIASFKQADDASHFVEKLFEAGISAQVQKVSLANLGIRYRVLTLPFSQRDKALEAKARIKEKFHLTGILVSE